MYTLRFRHHQHKKNGANIYYDYDSGNNYLIETATAPANFNYYWQDFSQSITGLDKLSFTYDTNLEQLSSSKSFSGSLRCYGEAFEYIKEWLLDNPQGRLNSIDVEVWDNYCNLKVMEAIIRPFNLQYCDEDCYLDVSLNELDEILECFKRTNIADNHQGWFHDDTAKQHPVFDYCAIVEPDVTRYVLMFLSLFFIWLLPLLIFISFIVNTIVFVINSILGFLDTIGFNVDEIDCDGDGDTSEPCISIPDLNDNLFELFFGCNRKHPAPFIRTYIQNVCDKCSSDLGITISYDTQEDIFNSQSYPYYNACYYAPVFKRGWPSDENKYWDEDNNPNIPFYDFLEDLKPVHNGIWYLDRLGVNNYVFKFVPVFTLVDPTLNNVVLDLSTVADREYLISEVCSEWLEEKLPSYLNINYADDGTDHIGNEAKKRYNDIVELNPNGNTQNFEASKDLNFKFSPVRIYDDYVGPEPYSARAEDVGAVANAFYFILGAVAGYNNLNSFSDDQRGKIIMSQHTCINPKLIIYDVDSPMLNARVKNYYTYVNGSGSLPLPYTPYNTISEAYNVAYKQKGDDRYKLYNYPYYVDAMFYTGVGNNNLYYNFYQWWYDYRLNPRYFRRVTFTLKYCCELVERFGLQFGDDYELFSLVKLPSFFTTGYPQFVYGLIEKIEVQQDTSDGKVLKVTCKV